MTHQRDPSDRGAVGDPAAESSLLGKAQSEVADADGDGLRYGFQVRVGSRAINSATGRMIPKLSTLAFRNILK